MNSNTMELQKAYHQCEEVIKEHSKTFYRAFSLLPKKQRQAVYAVYAFCRIVDDIVDEGEDVTVELAQFEEEFQQYIIERKPATHFMWVALQDVFNAFEMNERYFKEMIVGQKMDLYKFRYDTVEEVLDYSYHVASTVGLMLLPILAPEKIDVLTADAIALGKGMQLTNILRDIHEDYQRDRIYLPRDIMEKYQYTEADIQNECMNDTFVAMWEELAALAEEYYTQAASTISQYPILSQPPVRGALVLYREILNEIRRNQYTIFEQKHFVSTDMKQELLSEKTAN